MNNKTEYKEFVDKLEKELIAEHGYMVSQEPLSKLLGYKSLASFKMSLSRVKPPLPVFPIENRRGVFAMAVDIAQWMAKKRFQALKEFNTKGGV